MPAPAPKLFKKSRVSPKVVVSTFLDKNPSKSPKIAIAAASFSRLSPSRIESRRFGAPISRNVEITAPGSVVATAAPRSRHPAA